MNETSVSVNKKIFKKLLKYENMQKIFFLKNNFKILKNVTVVNYASTLNSDGIALIWQWQFIRKHHVAHAIVCFFDVIVIWVLYQQKQ